MLQGHGDGDPKKARVVEAPEDGRGDARLHRQHERPPDAGSQNRLAHERYVEGGELRCPFDVFFRFA